MTEPELTDEDDFGVRRDRVMERLAKLLAEATNPPDDRARLRDALKRGDFSSFTEDNGVHGEPEGRRRSQGS